VNLIGLLNITCYILFAGYMIMAFEVPSENTVALGTFQVNSDSHTINCHGMQQVISLILKLSQY